MAFDGVLTPESASFAGGRLRFPGPWHSRAPRNAPGPLSLSGTAGTAACGETGMAGPDSEPLDGGTLGRGRDSVSANRPLTPSGARARLTSVRTTAHCITLGLARGSGPFEPPTGESAPLAPPSPPPFPSFTPMTETSMAQEATGKLSTTTARAPPSERKALGGEVTRHPCAPPELLGWRVGPTPPP